MPTNPSSTAMPTILHGAVVPSGMIRSAKTYTLAIENNHLYIIRTGPASNLVDPNGPLRKLTDNPVTDRMAKTVQKNQEKISKQGFEVMSTARGSEKVALGSITNAELGISTIGDPFIKITTPKRSYTFHIRTHPKAEVEEFYRQLIT